VKAFSGTFVKNDGTVRTMRFVKITDLPKGFLNENTKGTGKTRNLADGKELVWDIEFHSFRVFNWKTVKGEVLPFDTLML
jgi:hypothetical protein